MRESRHRNARLGTLAAAVALLLAVLVAAPALGGSQDGKGAGKRASLSEFVLVTGQALAPRTKSVTIHVYDARSRKAVGSVCMQSSDQTTLATRANRKRAIFVGATENRESCGHPSVATAERRGTPRPDRRYSGGCYRLLPDGLRIIRYPDDFTAPQRANCFRRR